MRVDASGRSTSRARLPVEAWGTILISSEGQEASAHRSRLSSALWAVSDWQAPLAADPPSPRGSWRPRLLSGVWSRSHAPRHEVVRVCDRGFAIEEGEASAKGE